MLLTKDLTAKAKELTDMHVDLILKAMKQAPKSKRPTTKPKKTKPKKTSTKKVKGSKTDSAEKGEKTLGFTEDGMPSFKIGEDGEMPSEEEIMAWIEKSKAEQAAKELKDQKENNKGEQVVVDDEGPKAEEKESEKVEKHDEL